MDERNEKGQFGKGVSGNPAGRPPKARELAYLAVVAEEVTLDDFRLIIRKAKADATEGEDGRTRDYGRRWLADYLIGRPRQTLHINTGAGDARDEFEAFSDDELRAIVAAAHAGAGAGEPGGAEPDTG